MRDVGENLSERTEQSKEQDLIEKFRGVELLKPFFEEKVSIELNLGQLLLEGITSGQQEG